MSSDQPQPGLYERLLSEGETAALDGITGRQASVDRVDDVDAPSIVAHHLSQQLAQVLREAAPKDREALARLLSESIASVAATAGSQVPKIEQPLRRLAAIEPLAPTGEVMPIARPLTPIGTTSLMTNAPDEPAVGREIEAEIDSAESIDLVLAFIRWTGIRTLLAPLRRHVERGRQVRVVTTIYTGSTEARALDALRDLGAEIKVSYDTNTTRLHAKAWLFRRDSGFSTAYVGSSNLTHSAQVTGLEWNVRAAESANPEVIAGFERVFESYWADPHFEAYDPDRFTREIGRQRSADDDAIATPFEIEPYPFQQDMLDKLAFERSRGHDNTLVVAATGTGKTIIAALDYRRLRSELPRSRLLFLAHRDEILKQSQTAFRHVLRDGSFGERWVGGDRPEQWEYVFASVQSIAANDIKQLDPDHFDVVIVDEFHHAAASTYTQVLDYLRPHHLIGLTATPERTDALDIKRWFDGRTAVELRLWHALDQGLLAPFHYFGIHDGMDLSAVTWRQGGGYDTVQLTSLLTADDAWASKVIQATRDTVGDATSMKALGFCVSIDHAEFMADRFARAGIPAVAVSARSSNQERAAALRQLAEGRLSCVFAVDLFNEGVDIPSIDTVLMLRPTESATIFLQQLGRGLRRTKDKDVLTVLDFVGHQHKDFRFDQRFRTLLGRTRKQLENDIETNFPYLPAGCEINLDAVARKIVLDNVRSALPTRWADRREELRALGDVGLGTYLAETGLDLPDVYRGNHNWSELRRSVDLPTPAPGPNEQSLGKAIPRLAHIDDEERLDVLMDFLRRDSDPLRSLSTADRRTVEGMLLSLLNPQKGEYASLEAAASELWAHASTRAELLEVLELLRPNIDRHHPSVGLGPENPLRVHAYYSQQEILAAFGASTIDQPLRQQAGSYWHRESQTSLHFITLRKNEKDYSPTTRYNDYAINERLFHWETQARTSVDSEVGQRYIQQALNKSNHLLLIRKDKQLDGNAAPYLCAGLAHYVSHRSDRPIQITWELEHPLPGTVFTDFRGAVA